MARRAKPSGKPTTRVRETLTLKPFLKWLFEQARPVAILGLPRGLFPHTPSRMYALMMVKSPRRKPKRCLITELRRHEISGNRAAVVRLVQGVLHA